MKTFFRPTFLRVAPIALIGFVIFAGAVSNAAGQGIINEILARMDAHNKALTSLRANATMVKTNAQLGVSDTSEGTTAYLPIKGKDPAVRIDWTSPQKETLSVIDKKYLIIRYALKQAYTGTTDNAKGNAKAGSALAFMNMSRSQLKANYSVKYLGEETVKGGTKTWHLELTPNARTNYKSADVWVDGNGMPVQSRVTEHNSDTTTVLLTNLQKNVRINTAEFKPDTKGMKIIQG